MATPTMGMISSHGTMPIGFGPFGSGGTEPTSVRIAPEGPRPIATTVVPGASCPVARKSALTDPVESARTGWVP